MANTITNFLVGIGFDYDEKGAKQIGSGIDSIKSKALQLGAVVSGAFGIKALTSDFAQSTDTLGKFADVFGVGAGDVKAFGNALEQEGGTLESFMSQLEGIERLRAGLLVGDAGFIAQAGRAGIDTNQIESATTATEAYLALADQFAAMNQQQRINAAASLGLDDASIRLLSRGRDEVEQVVDKFRDIRPVTDDMTQSAAEFNRQWLETKQNIGGVADAISNELLPVINDVTREINSWFDENRMGTMRAAAELTKATFGIGTPEEIAAATGLPEWLFTPIGDLADQGMNTASDAIDNFLNTGTLSENVNSAYVPVPTQLSNPSQPVIPSGQFAPTPAQQAQAQNINVTLQLDGQTMDQRTIRVVDGMAQTALDDLASSTGG